MNCVRMMRTDTVKKEDEAIAEINHIVHALEMTL